jgi:Kelch motif
MASAVFADSWAPNSVINVPTARTAHSAVFTRIDGTDQMIVWGGQDSARTPFAHTGGLLKRSTNILTATTTTNAPSGREGQPAVWTGHEIIIWGGDDGINFLNTGGRYDPVQDVWRATSLNGAPDARFGHSFIWIGDRLIVWGGATGFGGDVNTGAIYDPVTDTWSPTTTVGAPTPRDGQASIWTGSQMLVWGESAMATT